MRYLRVTLFGIVQVQTCLERSSQPPVKLHFVVLVALWTAEHVLFDLCICLCLLFW